MAFTGIVAGPAASSEEGLPGEVAAPDEVPAIVAVAVTVAAAGVAAVAPDEGMPVPGVGVPVAGAGMPVLDRAVMVAEKRRDHRSM